MNVPVLVYPGICCCMADSAIQGYECRAAAGEQTVIHNQWISMFAIRGAKEKLQIAI
jgi:uncharacterized membrane protein YcgQ (UPF0703/DUF1980 family)